MQGIVLAGEPGSGKTTIATALCEILEWERKSFAGPLKDEVAMALARSTAAKGRVDVLAEHQRLLDEMSDPATKDNYRGILQWWGTEYRRRQNEDYWIQQFEETVSLNGSYVVDDCRFNNEMEVLKAYGFKFVRLEDGPTTRPVQAHASEVDWKTWEYDVVLSYEPGPHHQAERLVDLLYA